MRNVAVFVLVRVYLSSALGQNGFAYLENGLLAQASQRLRIAVCFRGHLGLRLVRRLFHAVLALPAAIDGVELH